MPKRSERLESPKVDERIPKPVRNILVELFGIDDTDFTSDSKVVDDLGADSLDLAELALALEAEYCVEISDALGEAWTVGTIGDVLKDLAKLGAKL